MLTFQDYSALSVIDERDAAKLYGIGKDKSLTTNPKDFVKGIIEQMIDAIFVDDVRIGNGLINNEYKVEQKKIFLKQPIRPYIKKKSLLTEMLKMVCIYIY